MPNRLTAEDLIQSQVFEPEVLEPLVDCTCEACIKDEMRAMWQTVHYQLYPELYDFYKEHCGYDMYRNTLPIGNDWIGSNPVGMNSYYGRVIGLDALRESNNRRIGQYKRHDIPYKFCGHCGKAGKEAEGKIIRRTAMDIWVCRDCVPLYFVDCVDCGEQIPRTNSITVDNDQLSGTVVVCRSCFNDKYFYCACCAQSHRKENGFSYFRESNEVREGVDAFVATGSIYHICSHCADPDGDEWSYCSGCDERFPRMIMQTDEDGDRLLCDECWEKFQIIRAWEWKPTPAYKLSPKNPRIRNDKLLYGLEIEIEREYRGCPVWEIAERILSWWGGEREIYVKNDATIENGLEIVTHPFSWQRFRDDRNKWLEFFDMVRESGYGADDWENVGIHVHMTKRAFTRFHLYKFLKFLYGQFNREFVETIAGRSDHDYAMWCTSDVGEGVKKTAKDKYNPSGERHAAVNLTGDSTVEVRIFASTVYHEVLFKDMEFLQSLFNFTKMTKTNHITIPHYWMWLTSKYNFNIYRTLIDFIKKNEAIKSTYSLCKEEGA